MNKKIAVLLSGNGSNLHAIIKKGINVSFVVSNNPEAPGLKIAEKFNIPTYSWKNLSALEEHVSELVKIYNINLVVLAGFMRLLSKEFINSLPQRSIINVHPSLLPKYGGKGMYGDNIHKLILSNKEKKTGITFHYVNENYDEGKIIAQYEIELDVNETLNSLKKKISREELLNYPKIISSFLNE